MPFERNYLNTQKRQQKCLHADKAYAGSVYHIMTYMYWPAEPCDGLVSHLRRRGKGGEEGVDNSPQKNWWQNCMDNVIKYGTLEHKTNCNPPPSAQMKVGVFAVSHSKL